MLMLDDMINDLIEAETDKEKEVVLRRFNRLGIDSATAVILENERLVDEDFFDGKIIRWRGPTTR